MSAIATNTPANTNNTTNNFGATYCTEAQGFGEITGVFPVGADWDGYRHHGYCRPTPEDIKAFGF